MASFLIWGAGGHSKVVADLVRAAGHTLAGFIDADGSKLNRVVESGGGHVSILQDDFLALVRANRLPDHVDAIALAIGGNNTRRLWCLHQLQRDVAPPLVHPSAIVSPSASLAAGTVVFAGAIINADARIGAAVIVNTGAIVEHDCSIADGVHLAPRSTLAGEVDVGVCAWIGAGATVLQQRSVGRDAVVGAGAVVIRDVADGSTVAGVPAYPLDHPRGRTTPAAGRVADVPHR